MTDSLQYQIMLMHLQTDDCNHIIYNYTLQLPLLPNPFLSSTMMILNFKVYWSTLNSTPLSNESIPIINGKSLADFIHHEIVTSHLSTTSIYADTDIKAIKSGMGVSKLHILNFPAKASIGSIEHESPAVLKVVIDRSTQQCTPAISAFDCMMVASKPTEEAYKSNWKENDVLSFQTGYETAVNKAKYLSSKTMEQKPNSDEQYETLGVGFLNGLGYKGGTGGEKKIAKNALKLMVFAGEERGTMGRSHVKKYDSSVLLSAVRGCVSAKVKLGKRDPLTKEMVLSPIKKVDVALAAFPM
jgi:hypothetical protein